MRAVPQCAWAAGLSSWAPAAGRPALAKETATLYHEAAEGMRMKAVTYSPDERQIYAVGDNWSIYRFPVALDALIVEAKKRLK